MDILGTLVGLFFLAIPLYIVYRIFLSVTSGSNTLFSPDFSTLTTPKYMIWGVLLVLGVFNIIGVDGNNWGYLAYALFDLSLLLGLVLVFNKKRDKIFWTFVITHCIAIIGVVARANEVVTTLNVFTAWITLVLLWMMHTYDQVEWSILWLSRNILRLLPKQLAHLRLLNAHRTESSNGQSKVSIFGWIKTLGIALVIFLFFLSLLSSADVVFAKIVEQYFSEVPARLFWSLLLAFLFIFKVTQRWYASAENRFGLGWLNFRDLGVSLGTVVILFTVFLVVQAKYLFFIQESDLVSFGVTYSEYVHKGFTELLVVAFFGGALVYVAAALNAYHKPEKMLNSIWERATPILAGVLGTQLLLVLFSALKRDIMYVDAYGFTRARIFGLFILFWLAITIVAITLYAFGKIKEEWKVLKVFLGASVAVVVLSNVIVIDNYVSFLILRDTRHTDHFYVANLSADAVSGWRASITQMETKVSELLQAGETRLLNDDEKMELARIKLALKSLIEQRNDLLRQYSDKDFLEKNPGLLTSYCMAFIGPEIVYPYTDCSESVNRVDYDEDIGSKIDRYKLQWGAYNLSRYQAAQTIQTNSDLFINKTESLLNDISAFQHIKQISLVDQERSLLEDYSYPLIDTARIYGLNAQDFSSEKYVNYTNDMPSFFQEELVKSAAIIRRLSTEPDRAPGSIPFFAFVNEASSAASVGKQVKVSYTNQDLMLSNDTKEKIGTVLGQLPGGSDTVTINDPDGLFIRVNCKSCPDQSSDAIFAIVTVIYNRETGQLELNTFKPVRELR